MSPLDSNKQVPNLRGEDGEGSVQVQMDPKVKIEGAKVEAEILKNGKNRTVLVFKKRRRKNSRRKNGHRQEYSMIRINKIFSKDGKVLSEAEKISKPSKKEEAKKETSK